MSKSLKNYPDPMEVVSKYGADALRFYLLSSQLMHAEDLYFSEKGLGDVYRKVIMRLNNVYSFYEMYSTEEEVKMTGLSTNVLDIWINARFNELVAKVSDAMDKYEIDRATRPIDEFIDDLSNWYLRRSRDRFKSEDKNDKNWAIVTTKNILRELSKVMAPFMPFISDDIYRKVGGVAESVHLETWPKIESIDAEVLTGMNLVRSYSNSALMLRSENKVNVRQPLHSLTIKYSGDEPKYWDGLKEILQDEINVKEIILEKSNGNDESPISLDFNLTDELRAEGNFREATRLVQDLRKKTGLNPGELVDLTITTDEAGKKFIETYSEELKRLASLNSITFASGEGEVAIGEFKFSFLLNK
jgi:isoleucyl-tRNA synthetase